MSTETEYTGIFLAQSGSRPVMSTPPPMQASRKLVQIVADARDQSTSDEDLADWLADFMERFGARTAQPVIDMEGNGPLCSWCSAIWPLCGHDHQADDRRDEEVTS